jgi:glycosyltransferase involved in cell wall biosynthesis
MRVTVVTYDFPSDDNPAAGRFIHRHVHALACDHDVRIVQARVHLSARWEVSVGRRQVDGLAVETVTVSGPPGPAHANAASLVSQHAAGTDVLHTMAFESLLLGRLVKSPAPWVHTEHSSNATDLPHGLAGVYVRGLRPLLRRPALVTAVSGYLEDGIRRLGRTGPTRVVPNVVEVPTQGRPTRRRQPQIVSVGGLVPSKRPLLSLAITAELRRRGTDVRLVWVGDGPMAAAFGREAARLGLESVVELRPFCAPEEYLSVLAGADVFLLPTEFETFCVSAAEAIALGVPVVVGDRGGHVDFVDETNGVLVPGNDTANYADAVTTVLARGRTFPGPDAATRVRERFSRGAVAELFQQAYDAAGVRPQHGLP